MAASRSSTTTRNASSRKARRAAGEVAERRRSTRQEARIDGQRATDPRLTTRDCGDRLGVSPGFIVGEIRDGRLPALVLEREGLRTIYRITPRDFEGYCRRFEWHPEAVKPVKPVKRADATHSTDPTDEPQP